MTGPLVVAHRGAGAEAPENTLEAFALAAELGADAFELDVRRSADGVLVVIHDATLDRTTGVAGPVGARGSAELAGLGVPRLEEVFGRWRDLPMTVDVKEPDATGDVVALIGSFGRTERTILYVEDGTRREDFRTYAGERATSTWQALRLALLRWLPGMPGGGFPEVVHTPLRRFGIPIVTPGFVADARANGLRVQVWTGEDPGVRPAGDPEPGSVDDPAVMLRLAEWGVDAIVTNDVRAARRCLDDVTAYDERETDAR
ncbi:MAG TPA: glycerophosphodiester phosphodiesterase family protein [Gemmatimonadota bacterium]|nr:glycerophosphodiester phosphodiesterase family protein [Gemmatimonadota bacterium]